MQNAWMKREEQFSVTIMIQVYLGDLMTKEIIPVEVKYSNSLGKWKGIREFCELNDINTSKIDAMIARIEKVGDVELGRTITFEIRSYEHLLGSIYGDDNHPCPHCAEYNCTECPLDDANSGCCKEWSEVKEQLQMDERR